MTSLLYRGSSRAAALALAWLGVGCDGADLGSTSGPGSSSTGTATDCTGLSRPSGDVDFELQSGGRARLAVVHAPPGYDPTKRTPVVLALHYAVAMRDQLEEATRISEATDAAGALVVYPRGVGNTWNAGRSGGTAWDEQVDDVGYVNDLLDALPASFCMDETRVFAAGFSSGGHMTYRLGCELSERLAGLAVVSGAVHVEGPCTPARALSLLHFHGTADVIVPFEGGEGEQATMKPLAGDHTFPSVDETLGIWREAGACTDETRETYRNGDATCEAQRSCDEGTTVESCTIDGGGHTWPGGTLPAYLGKASVDIDASQKIVSFFGELPSRGPGR